MTAAEKIVERVAGTELEPGLKISVSAGIATYPRHASDRGELVQAADKALYEAKRAGKGRARLFHPDLVDIAELHKLAEGPDREARLRAAATLAYAVDARDAYTGSHSHAVGELAAEIATRLRLSSEDIQLVRLAGRLHDLGKLAIPEEILRKPDALSDSERLVLERHPQIGFRMLQSLGVEPITTWVLHHHERWDGQGYPEGLAGETIPLGARIIFVADAYDAMTTERVYGTRLSPAQALAELGQCAGTQFDPTIVAAFLAEERGQRADRRPERLVGLGLGVDLDLGVLVQGEPARHVEAKLSLGLLACGRRNLDEEGSLTAVLHEAACAAERFSELGHEPGGADQDAKGADGDWT